jgi:hypothetical protein
MASILKMILRKTVTLILVGAVFGWLYQWSAPWSFPKDRAAGFGYGLLHGAMMPLTLPSLVCGLDVRIYDEDNSGRTYKIGYICGVNICGLAFIGPLFWRPNRKPGITQAGSGNPGNSQ